jgi:hypothetical protein
MEGTGRIWFTPQRLADIPRGRTDVCFRRKSGHRAGYASQRRWLEWPYLGWERQLAAVNVASSCRYFALMSLPSSRS